MSCGMRERHEPEIIRRNGRFWDKCRRCGHEASHSHRAIPHKTKRFGFSGALKSDKPNPVAHGGTMTIAVCKCGMKRRANHNSGQTEFGHWVSEDE